MRNQVFKKLFSVLLALIMVAGLLPASVLAEGEGNADSTPAPTEAVQPTESAEPTAPTETEAPEVTEVPEPTPENPAATVEPTQGEPTAEPTDEGIMPANVMPVQANVAARDISKDGFIRIFHLDCGRKYFSVSEINGIIDQLAENNYTHIQLAFGNDGLRFLLNDMSVTVNGKTYDSDSVKTAIKKGNSQLTNGSSGELSQSEMESIISHANDKGIKVIPLFNAPGHMYAVVNAMNSLGVNGKYIQVSNPYDARTPNWAVDPTDANAVAFAEALLGKYVAYFASKGSTMFNIGADESGINNGNYAAYATMVNAMNSIVKSEGMTTLAYNDGIYNTSFASSYPNVTFDNDIVICYWTSGANSESVANLLNKGFKILNNSDNWYYVLGDYLYTAWGNNGQWGYEDALNGIKNTPVTNMKDYNGSEKPIGSILCVWCDAPNQTYEPEKVYDLIKTMANANPDYFKKEAANVPAVEISENETNVKTTKETVDGKTVYKAAVKADGTSTIQLKVVNIDNTVNWASDNNDIATVDENGLVTFKGAAGTVTITAIPEATKGETAAGYSITFSVAKEGEIAPVTKDVTVTIGATFEDKIEGDVSNNIDETNYNSSIATYTIEVKDVTASAGDPVKQETIQAGGKYIIGYNGNYIKLNGTTITNTNNQDEATEWTIESNTTNGIAVWNIKSGNYYLSYYNNGWGLYVKTSAEQVSWAYDGTGFKYYTTYNNSSYYLQYNNSKWTVSTTNSNRGAAYVKGTPTEAGKQTTVTIKGVAEGDTTVTIGHVTYNVHVTKEDLTNVSPLPVQLWITNNAIEAANSTSENYWAASWSQGTNNGNAFYVNISAGVAYGAEGASIVDLMPNKIMRYEFGGTYFEKARDGKADKELVVWSGRVHGSSNAQKIYGKDYSNVGTEFKYIRYLGGKWEVSNNRVDWTKVEGTNTLSTEQVVVYYMIRSEITEEITTDVADWGYWNTDTNYSDRINANSYVILDFAVKIDGAERKPSSFPQNGKTFVFHCDSGAEAVVGNDTYTRYRQLNNFRAVDNLGENYEVYKVTVTMTKDGSDSSSIIQNTTNYAYEGEEQIIWAIDEDVRNASGLNNYVSISGANSVYNGCKIGGDPYIRGVEVYNQHGALITYYIRAKAVLSNLRVHYRIEGSDKDFYFYGIIAAENTVFGENFGVDRNAETWLKDNVVTDKDGHTITVTAKLENVDGMGAQYKYGNYEFKRTAREDNDVYLYYTFNANVTFVVDFGLPLKIMPKDVSPNLANANIESVTASSQMSRYADVTIGKEDFSITYTLKTMISGADLVTVTYEGTNSGGKLDKAAFNIHIIPATSVYYEDSFAKFTAGSGAAKDAKWASVYDPGTDATTNANATQALEALGQENHNPYGYDSAYNSCTMFSMGSARKVTVTNDMATTGVVWPTAQFTFKGTGFDIISLTDNTSGAIYVSVYPGDKAEGTPKKYVVNNYYGYDYFDGKWVVKTDAGNNALYQIPVIKIKDLDYGTYTVVIKVAYSAFQDVADKKQYSFWLDAVRVYDPMGTNNSDTYAPDGEAKPVFVEVRDMLLSASSVAENNTNNGVVFIDGNGSAAIATDYKNFGPNHEVYLANNQAIAFRIADATKYADIQIGIKSTGNSVVKYKINNDTEATIGTATDMYYSVKDYASNGSVVTIINTGETVLSITNIKCTMGTSSAKTDTVDLVMSAEDVAVAISMVNSAITPVEPEPEPEPEKTFEPDRFEASWSRNVMQGRKATLTVKTSEDVEAITVDGQTIRSYRTRTERMGFGRRAKRITYREFTYSMVAQESADFSVTAINAEGTESEAITARLTVKTRPNSMRDMWDWFKGWF